MGESAYGQNSAALELSGGEALGTRGRAQVGFVNKRVDPQFIRVGNASLQVSRKLRALANAIFEREPVLARMLVDEAMKLRRSFRPARKIPKRAA